jgi:hypothetical protein
MRDPARISALLRRVEALWRKYPDWRLGQLLLNAAEWADEDLWNLEDDRLASVLEEHLNRQLAESETGTT